MTYFDKFDRKIILDMDQATELAARVVMKEGELRFREDFIKYLEKDVAEYLDEVDYEPNLEWLNGVRYCIHLLKNIDLDPR